MATTETKTTGWHPARAAAVAVALALSGAAHAQTPPVPPAASPAAQPAQLACTGPFAREASHASLVEIVGKESVVFEKVDGAEGEKIPATVLFAKIPQRRLEIIWADAKKRRGIANVNLSATSTWIAPNGVRIGMSLAEVEKLNGRPFELSGFDWDYGGYVTDWKDGALATPPRGGCVVHVRFTVPDGAPEAAAAKVAGDTNFPSTDKNMRAVKPIVGSLGFGYPQP